MKDVKIIVKDVRKDLSEKDAQKALAENTIRIMKSAWLKKRPKLP